MTQAEIKEFLTNVRNRASSDAEVEAVKASLVALKQAAVFADDESLAKLIWCYERVLDAQVAYVKAFSQLKDGQYYAGWCTLEQTEGLIKALSRHVGIGEQFALGIIYAHTQRFQSLFPYKYFFSPGILILDSHCSICKAPRKLRTPCGHAVGEIYSGDICCRVITKMKLLEMSFVTKPVQKYSVLFTKDNETGEQVDHYDYSLVEYAAACLSSPFNDWDVKWSTKRHPHSRYLEIGPADPCPCESEKTYQECCLKESGVLRPHLDLILRHAPPSDVPVIAYSRKQ